MKNIVAILFVVLITAAILLSETSVIATFTLLACAAFLVKPINRLWKDEE